MYKIPRGYSLQIEFVVEDCLDGSSPAEFDDEADARQFIAEWIAKFQKESPAHSLVTVKEIDLGQWEWSVAVPGSPIETFAVYLFKRTYLVDDFGGRERVENGVYAH